MRRDFALRLDSLLAGVRASLGSIVDVMRHHIREGDLSEDEFKQYVALIGESMGATVEVSRDLHRLFPDIVPSELKSN